MTESQTYQVGSDTQVSIDVRSARYTTSNQSDSVDTGTRVTPRSAPSNYGVLTPLIQDPSVEDISVDDVGEPIYVFHRVHGELRTDISMTEQEFLTIAMELVKSSPREQVSDSLLSTYVPDLDAEVVISQGSQMSLTLRFPDSLLPPEDLPERYDGLALEGVARVWSDLQNGHPVLSIGTTGLPYESFIESISQLYTTAPIYVDTNRGGRRVAGADQVPNVSEVPDTGLFVSTAHPSKITELEGRSGPALLAIHADSPDVALDSLGHPPANAPKFAEAVRTIVQFTRESDGRVVAKTHAVRPQSVNSVSENRQTLELLADISPSSRQRQIAYAMANSNLVPTSEELSALGSEPR